MNWNYFEKLRLIRLLENYLKNIIFSSKIQNIFNLEDKLNAFVKT